MLRVEEMFVLTNRKKLVHVSVGDIRVTLSDVTYVVMTYVEVTYVMVTQTAEVMQTVAGPCM